MFLMFRKEDPISYVPRSGPISFMLRDSNLFLLYFASESLCDIIASMCSPSPLA